MGPKVNVGITTIIGYLVALGGIIPIVVKLLEEGGISACRCRP